MMNVPQMMVRGFLRTLLMRVLRVLVLLILILWAVFALTPRAEDPFAKTIRGIKPTVALIVVHAKTKTTNDAATAGSIDEVYGSGAVVRSSGSASFLLTDAHVIDAAQQIEVRFDDGRKFAATVLERDDAHDAAIIRVDVGRLPVIALGTSRSVLQGDPIGVAGYPIPDGFVDEHLGTGLSVYAGRIASIRSSAFELDLPVIPGESGGPVFDARDGTVIGIAESRFDDERAIGFATPIDALRPLLNRIP